MKHANRPNAMIYSAGLDGHRQVYVFVLTQFLTTLDYNIFIAGNLSEKAINAFYISKLKENNRITFIDTSSLKNGGLDASAQDLIEFQRKFNIILTIFAEADHHISLFNSQILQKSNRLRGRNIGIFLRPFYIYRKFGVLEKLRYLKHLRHNLLHDERMFHSFLLKRMKLLNESLYIDEHFVEKHAFALWIPDVFQQYVETLLNEQTFNQRQWISRLDNFLEKNRGRFVFYYFGTSQRRRGYDYVLKLAVAEKGCFVHCGLRASGEEYEFDVDELRNVLIEHGSLLETDEYITDPFCIEYFFKSITHLVLPYRNFYGSSGVMLQALTYGIPVLVPEDGLMGFRVKKHDLGMTYQGDFDSLSEQFAVFKKKSKEEFAAPISKFMDQQSTVKLEEKILSYLR